MGLRESLGALRGSAVAVRRWRWSSPKRPVRLGDTDVVDARRIADAERATRSAPDGCAWLDHRTIEDVDLALVFRAVDRTATPTGAQALWRWLVAPAVRLDVLDEREAALAKLAQPEARDRVRHALAGQMTSDAPHLPRLLWEAHLQPQRTRWFVALAGALLALALLAVWWPPLLVGCAVLLAANILIDQVTSARYAHQGYALGTTSTSRSRFARGSRAATSRRRTPRTAASIASCARECRPGATRCRCWSAPAIRPPSSMRSNIGCDAASGRSASGRWLPRQGGCDPDQRLDPHLT